MNGVKWFNTGRRLKNKWQLRESVYCATPTMMHGTVSNSDSSHLPYNLEIGQSTLCYLLPHEIRPAKLL